MGGRKPEKFVLKPKDKAIVRELLRDGQTPWRVARRAQLLLGRTTPHQSLVGLSDKAGAVPSTVWRVCQRYRQHGLQAALYDASRSGRPRVFFQKGAAAD
jgi:hypothetical protein